MIAAPHTADAVFPQPASYRTAGGVVVHRRLEACPYADAADGVANALDGRLGVLLSSSFEYPGRYTRWDIGFTDPPLQVTTTGRQMRIRALNDRGRMLLPAVRAALDGLDAVETMTVADGAVTATVRLPAERFPEELRSKQPSVFSVLRAVIDRFAADDDPHLGLYGAFGYDLAFQFEPIRQRLTREPGQRDLVLYLPDRILVVDHYRRSAVWHLYDFEVDGLATAGLPREGAERPYAPAADAEPWSDHAAGDYQAVVAEAREAFRRGDLFEVVPGQTFFEPCPAPPSEIFRRLRTRNPSPYGFLMNLGEAEYLVGASPEMYVRCEGQRIETCPISGTIARGGDAIADARQILALLNSEKDAAELTMCTDVDRNDKSRVCEPGSVTVIGRRQIEMYSRLIHTVDHVVGVLREGYDALDGFLSHAWAVTVTGAPKAWAMQFIEDHERTPRRWYGGAVGAVHFNGGMNTGLTLRTIRIADGVAAVRAGATLLYDSDPDAEDGECRLKASALLDAIRRPSPAPGAAAAAGAERPGAGRRLLLVDHEDSFVHTLANYFRQLGADVTTLRPEPAREAIRTEAYDLVVLSPGPGRPEDFATAATIGAALDRGLPLFGVCLGLQGLVEYYGGRLGVLGYPMHGKASVVRVRPGRLFEGLPESFAVGRYHSLFGERDSMPAELEVTAESEDGVVMAVEHRTLPVAAVQFHPESILTLEGGHGLRLVANVLTGLCPQPAGATAPAD